MHANDIQELIKSAMPEANVQVSGEDGVHFEATIVAEEFEGLNQVKRQQKIYAALGNRFQSGEIHALALKTYTQAEWDVKHG